MAQLILNIAKGVSINNLVCSPNTIVLAKQSTSTNIKTGEVSTNVRFIEVCKVEKTEPLAILQNLLKYCVAEFMVCNKLERDFAETNIKQRKLFNQFLSGNIIYRTNSEGKISHALISDIPLRQTALNVKNYHTIVTCKKENLKAAIFKHAKAILAQCAYPKLIIEQVKTLDKAPEKTVKETKTVKSADKTTNAKTTASTKPAPAAIPTAIPAVATA